MKGVLIVGIACVCAKIAQSKIDFLWNKYAQQATGPDKARLCHDKIFGKFQRRPTIKNFAKFLPSLVRNELCATAFGAYFDALEYCLPRRFWFFKFGTNKNSFKQEIYLRVKKVLIRQSAFCLKIGCYTGMSYGLYKALPSDILERSWLTAFSYIGMSGIVYRICSS